MFPTTTSYIILHFSPLPPHLTSPLMVPGRDHSLTLHQIGQQQKFVHSSKCPAVHSGALAKNRRNGKLLPPPCVCVWVWGGVLGGGASPTVFTFADRQSGPLPLCWVRNAANQWPTALICGEELIWKTNKNLKPLKRNVGPTIIWNHLNYFKFYFTWIPNTCPLWCIIYFFLHFQYLNIYNVLMWCPVEHWLGVDVFRSYFTSDMECPQYRMQMTATTRGNCGAGIDCLNKSVTLLWRGLVFDTWVSEENSVSRCQGQMAKHRTSAQSHGVDVSVEMTVKVHLQHDDVHTFIH